MKLYQAWLCILPAIANLGCNDAFKEMRADSSNSSLNNYDPLANVDEKTSSISSEKARLTSGMDLVIAIDTSGSMREEKEAVENNIQDLLLDLQKSDLDPRIHVIAGGGDRRREEGDVADAFSFPVGIEVARAALIAEKVGSNDALSKIASLLSGELDDKYFDVNGESMDEPLKFRNGAQLELLIVSDDDGSNDFSREDDFSNLAEDFDPENYWQATVSGIVGLPDSAESGGACEIARVGTEYINLTKKTGGSLLDICSKDWSALLQRYSKDVKKRSASILLGKKPLGPQRILVSLDGKALGTSAWTYDEKENRVYLAAGTAYKSGMVLEVKYVHEI